VRIFKAKQFAKFARRERVTDALLKEAIDRARKGSVAADLGGHLIKQRVARPGQGRSGGYRVLIAFHGGERSIFLYGFAKSDLDNISPRELSTLRDLASAWLNASDEMIDAALKDGLLTEIK
jgi:hypothetical protein